MKTLYQTNKSLFVFFTQDKSIHSNVLMFWKARYMKNYDAKINGEAFIFMFCWSVKLQNSI